jgi:hypothetical protein
LLKQWVAYDSYVYGGWLLNKHYLIAIFVKSGGLLAAYQVYCSDRKLSKISNQHSQKIRKLSIYPVEYLTHLATPP